MHKNRWLVHSELVILKAIDGARRCVLTLIRNNGGSVKKILFSLMLLGFAGWSLQAMEKGAIPPDVRQRIANTFLKTTIKNTTEQIAAIQEELEKEKNTLNTQFKGVEASERKLQTTGPQQGLEFAPKMLEDLYMQYPGYKPLQRSITEKEKNLEQLQATLMQFQVNLKEQERNVKGVLTLPEIGEQQRTKQQEDARAEHSALAPVVPSSPLNSPSASKMFKKTFAEGESSFRLIRSKIIRPVTLSAAAVAGVVALYAGLKKYQKKRILNVLAKYGLTRKDLSPIQRDMAAAAVSASYRIPGFFGKLRSLVTHNPVASENVSQEIMWTVLTELYYRKKSTPELMQALKDDLIALQ